MHTKYSAKACGKIILFGEHFVVYGIPAIAASISNVAIVDIRPSNKTVFRTSIEGTIPELTGAAIKNIFNVMGIKKNYDIYLRGNLPTFGGLGSSAAFCVALARALAKAEDMDLNDEDICRIAYEGEKAFHGNPSGIDNTLSVYGGVKLFIRGNSPDKNVFYDIPIKKSLNILVVYSGKPSRTAEMVSNVRGFRDKNPQRFEHLCKEMLHIVTEGKKALAEHSVETIGNLMNKNQELLREIGVSYEINEYTISLIKSLGAVGVKITGGGGGGAVIGLFKTEKESKIASEFMVDEGYISFPTKIPYT